MSAKNSMSLWLIQQINKNKHILHAWTEQVWLNNLGELIIHAILKVVQARHVWWTGDTMCISNSSSLADLRDFQKCVFKHSLVIRQAKGSLNEQKFTKFTRSGMTCWSDVTVFERAKQQAEHWHVTQTFPYGLKTWNWIRLIQICIPVQLQRSRGKKFWMFSIFQMSTNHSAH